MIKYLTIALLTVAASAHAQTVILEENFTTGIPATWSLFNVDGLVPDTAVSEFTSAWIGTIIGSDTAAASTSFYDPDTVGTANDYLVTPRINIGNFSRLLWSARSIDASYPDGYQVLISTTDSLPGSFTDTLLTVEAETAYFSNRGIELNLEGYANQDIFIAFQNNTQNGFILLIDNVKVLGAETASLPRAIEKPLAIYPNPTADYLNVSTADPILAISIYTTSGQLLLEGQENRIDVSNLTKGLYLVRIETKNGVQTRQFVKH